MVDMAKVAHSRGVVAMFDQVGTESDVFAGDRILLFECGFKFEHTSEGTSIPG